MPETESSSEYESEEEEELDSRGNTIIKPKNDCNNNQTKQIQDLHVISNVKNLDLEKD